MLIFYNTVLNFLIIQFYDMQLHNMNDMQNKYRLNIPLYMHLLGKSIYWLYHNNQVKLVPFPINPHKPLMWFLHVLQVLLNEYQDQNHCKFPYAPFQIQKLPPNEFLSLKWQLSVIIYTSAMVFLCSFTIQKFNQLIDCCYRITIPADHSNLISG